MARIAAITLTASTKSDNNNTVSRLTVNSTKKAITKFINLLPALSQRLLEYASSTSVGSLQMVAQVKV